MLSGRALAARFVSQNETESLPKTSGSKGLQVYVPLNTAATFDQTKDLSRALAQHLEARTSEARHFEHVEGAAQRKSIRRLEPERRAQDDSLRLHFRAKEEPTVSTPVTWEEVANCLKKKKADLLKFRSEKTLSRVEKMGDLFAPVEELKQKLPKKWKL